MQNKSRKWLTARRMTDIYIYIYIENLQQTRLCGARSGSPQLLNVYLAQCTSSFTYLWSVVCKSETNTLCVPVLYIYIYIEQAHTRVKQTLVCACSIYIYRTGTHKQTTDWFDSNPTHYQYININMQCRKVALNVQSTITSSTQF